MVQYVVVTEHVPVLIHVHVRLVTLVIIAKFTLAGLLDTTKVLSAMLMAPVNRLILVVVRQAIIIEMMLMTAKIQFVMVLLQLLLQCVPIMVPVLELMIAFVTLGMQEISANLFNVEQNTAMTQKYVVVMVLVVVQTLVLANQDMLEQIASTQFALGV